MLAVSPRSILAWLLSVLLISPATADTVVLRNGDKLTGVITQIVDETIKFQSPDLGLITIPLANIQSFETDRPVTLQPRGRVPSTQAAMATGTPTRIRTPDGLDLAMDDVKAINPPREKWRGNLIGTLNVARGNSDTTEAGVRGMAELRRDNQYVDDRFTLAGAYRYGDAGLGDGRQTTRDNWDALAKYDRFFDEDLYTFVQMRVEHDRIADLDYRLTPGVGVGYQWVESPRTNVRTEIGVSYVYERFGDDSTNDFVGPRLAYHIDHKLADNLTVFHNMEFLPAFDDLGDYVLTTDVGLRVRFAKGFFTEVRFELKRDSEPSTNAEKNDLRYVVGVGWEF
jgi:putative salt-induced outer membrane protein YdiY